MRQIEYDALSNYFASQLKILLKSKGLRPKRIAEAINRSVSYVNDLLMGRRQPSLDTLFSISENLNIDLNELIKCEINNCWIQVNEEKQTKKVSFIRFNNSRSSKEEAVELIEEEFFLDDQEYKSENFIDYAVRYLADLYSAEYKEFKKNKYIESASRGLIRTDNKLFKEVVDLLYDMDDIDLTYLKQQILLNQKYQLSFFKRINRGGHNDDKITRKIQ